VQFPAFTVFKCQLNFASLSSKFYGYSSWYDVP